MSTLKDTALQYFDAFGRKDLPFLRNAFGKEVSLRDWDITAKGLDSVIRVNANVFESLEFINIEVVNIFEARSTVIAELVISGTGLTPLKIVDILTFDGDGKITAIRAYKG